MVSILVPYNKDLPRWETTLVVLGRIFVNNRRLPRVQDTSGIFEDDLKPATRRLQQKVDVYKVEKWNL